MIRCFELAAAVLKNPTAVVDRSDDPAEMQRDLVPLLGIALVGTTIFGVVVGSYRGGLQVPFAAIKMPLLLWIPVVLTLPACKAFFTAADVEMPWRRVGMAGVVAMARTAILAAAAGPALWLFYSVEPGYHLAVLALAGALALVGLPGMSVLAQAGPTKSGLRWTAVLATLLVLGISTAQTGWLLRPFIARPTADVTLLRPLEEDIFSALGATSRSAAGDYSHDWDPESKGLLRRRK